MSSSIKVYIESKKAFGNYNDIHKKFKLENAITPKLDEKIVLNILDSEIPVAFYNINSNNNRNISYIIGGEKTQIIAIGNYSGEELATLISTNSLSATYNNSTNKFSFKSSTGSTGTIQPNIILGITTTLTLNATGGAYNTAQSQAKFSGINNIFIRIKNLGGHNLDSYGKNSDIFGKIPVDTDFGGVISYLDHHNTKQKLDAREINQIDIELVDSDGYGIGGDDGLGGMEWNMTLLFSFEKDEDGENIHISGKNLLDKLHKVKDELSE